MEPRIAAILIHDSRVWMTEDCVHTVHHFRGFPGIVTEKNYVLLQTWRPYILSFKIKRIIGKELVSESAHEWQWKSDKIYSTFRDMGYGTYIYTP
jgi:hypothetical protein